MNSHLSRLESIAKTIFPGKSIILGLLSFLLTSLMFDPILGLFGLTAPIPLVMGILLYGKKIMAKISVIFLVFGMIVYAVIHPIPITYLSIVLFSNIMSIFFYKNISPIKGVFLLGTPIVLIIWLTIFSYKLVTGISFKVFLINNINILGKNVPKFAEIKDEIISALLSRGPVIISFIPYLMIWFAFIFLLKRKSLWKKNVFYIFNLDLMLKFRTSFELVYPLIIGLIIAVLSNNYHHNQGILFSSILLSIIGIFYFFQGVGVVNEGLDHFGIKGFFKTFFMIFLVLRGEILLPLIGIIDTWIDFRKFYKKNKGEHI